MAPTTEEQPNTRGASTSSRCAVPNERRPPFRAPLVHCLTTRQEIHRTPMNRIARHRPFLAVLAGGLLLRLALAYVVFPGEGLASDLGLFQGWATTLARVGPASFYAAAPSAN